MTDLAVVQKTANSTTVTSQYLKSSSSITSSALFIERSEFIADTLKYAYRYNPFTKSIVEINPSQAWFWTPEWLEGELEVEEEKLGGHFEVFDNIEDFFNM